MKRVKTFAGRQSKDGAKEGSGNFVRRLSLKVPRKRTAATRGEQQRRRHSDGDEEQRDSISEDKDSPKGRGGLSVRGTQRSVAITEDKEGEAVISKTKVKSERENLQNKKDECNLSKNKTKHDTVKATGDACQSSSSANALGKSLEEKDSKIVVTSNMKFQEVDHFSSSCEISPSTVKEEDQRILSSSVPVTPNEGNKMSDTVVKTPKAKESTPIKEDSKMTKRGGMTTTMTSSSQRRSKTDKTETSLNAAKKSIPPSPQSNSSVKTEFEQSATKMAATSRITGQTSETDISVSQVASIYDSGSSPLSLNETNEGDANLPKTKVITGAASNLKRRLSRRSFRKSNKTENSPKNTSESTVEKVKLTESQSEHSKEPLHVQQNPPHSNRQEARFDGSMTEVDMGLSRDKSISESAATGRKTTPLTPTSKEQWRKVSSFVRSGSKRLSSSIKSKVSMKDRAHSDGKHGNSSANDSLTEESNPTSPDDAVKAVGPDDILGTTGPENVVKDENMNETPKPKKPAKLNIAPTDMSQERATHYKLQQDTKKLNKEWVDAQEKLNSFVDNAVHSLSDGVDFKKAGEQDGQQDDIMTSHWADEKQLKTCPGCERSFSVRSKKNFKKKNKPDHCRKCGRVFCKRCLQNARKLNTFAQYDPFGKEYPVCSECYRPQTAIPTLGCTSSHTGDFKKYRESFTKHGWDEEMDIKEFRFIPTFATCIRQSKRLVGGYRRYLQDKDVSTVLDLSNVSTKVPEWQKAPTWVDPKSQEGCQLCNSGRLDTVHNCRLCGRRVCSQDSNKNFMLYLPDKDTPEHSGDINPLWKMIQIVGCPEREPAVKLYLRICCNCQEKLEILQEKLYQQMMVTIAADYEKCEKTVLDIHRKTQEMKKTIQTLLPQFREKVNNLTTDPRNIPSSTIKDISKQQDDLMEQFPRYIMAVEKLREMSPQTEQQMKLVRNLLVEKQTFYKENVTTFRLSVRQLVEILPNEVMQEIKDMVNRDAINNTYNDLIQLAFEADDISKKYQLSLDIADALKKAKQVCEGELKPMVLKNNPGNATEIWNNHKKSQEKYAESRAKSEGRFLQPNESNMEDNREYLPKYIKRETLQRVTYSSLQLKAKSSNRSFKNTKMALETLLTHCR